MTVGPSGSSVSIKQRQGGNPAPRPPSNNPGAPGNRVRNRCSHSKAQRRTKGLSLNLYRAPGPMGRERVGVGVEVPGEAD